MMGVNKDAKPWKLCAFNSMMSKNVHNPVKFLPDVIFFDFNNSFVRAEIIIDRLSLFQ